MATVEDITKHETTFTLTLNEEEMQQITAVLGDTRGDELYELFDAFDSALWSAGIARKYMYENYTLVDYDN